MLTDFPIAALKAGVAKVDIEKRRYAWIWTRQLVNWVRMRLWW